MDMESRQYLSRGFRSRETVLTTQAVSNQFRLTALGTAVDTDQAPRNRFEIRTGNQVLLPALRADQIVSLSKLRF